MLGDAVACGNHRIEQCLVEIVAETSHLTGRRHVYTQYWVSILQTGKGELRSLDTDAVDVKLALSRNLIGSIKHDAGSRINEVALENLAHEGERTGGAEVALDDLDVAALGEVLDIERSADVELFGDAARNLLDAADGGEIDILCGEHHGSIA